MLLNKKQSWKKCHELGSMIYFNFFFLFPFPSSSIEFVMNWALLFILVFFIHGYVVLKNHYAIELVLNFTSTYFFSILLSNKKLSIILLNKKWFIMFFNKRWLWKKYNYYKLDFIIYFDSSCKRLLWS